MAKHNMTQCIEITLTQGIDPTCTFMGPPICRQTKRERCHYQMHYRHYKGKQCELLAAKANTSYSKLTNWMTPLGRKPSATEPSFHVERDGKLVVGSSKSVD